MRVGSLVVCVDDSNLRHPELVNPIFKDRIYTIRNFTENGVGLRLEEIHNKINPFFGLEQGYALRRFRELDAPTEINLENILKNELV